MFNKLLTVAGPIMGKAAFKAKLYAPTILTVGGVIGTGVSLYLMSKATIKGIDIDKDYEKQYDKLQELYNDPIKCAEKGIDEAEKEKGVKALAARRKLDKVKNYAASIALAAVSMVAVICSHGMMHSRNSSLATALAATTATLVNTQDAIKERYGEEVAQEIAQGVKLRKESHTEIGKNGKEKTVVTNVKEANPDGPAANYGPWAWIFDIETAPDVYTADLNFNLKYLNNRVFPELVNEKASRGYSTVNDLIRKATGDKYADKGFVGTQHGWGPKDTIAWDLIPVRETEWFKQYKTGTTADILVVPKDVKYLPEVL